mmetsp:Transcript_12395/g.26612  ORF Transcript_12395/g.26612 Transcript_12395/m.26612 type:complete len:207 (-) Transcript_12395:381-1001(-)
MDDSFFMDHVQGEEGLPKHSPAQFNLDIDDFTLGSSRGRALLDTKRRRQHGRHATTAVEKSVESLALHCHPHQARPSSQSRRQHPFNRTKIDSSHEFCHARQPSERGKFLIDNSLTLESSDSIWVCRWKLDNHLQIPSAGSGVRPCIIGTSENKSEAAFLHHASTTLTPCDSQSLGLQLSTEFQGLECLLSARVLDPIWYWLDRLR